MTSARLSISVVTAIFSIVLGASCSSSSPEITAPDSPPDFSGTAAVPQEQGEILTVLVTIDPSEAGGVPQRRVHVHPNTLLLLRERDGTYRRVARSEIVPGAILRVKTTGVEYRSDPPQYDAVWIEIIPPLT